MPIQRAPPVPNGAAMATRRCSSGWSGPACDALVARALHGAGRIRHPGAWQSHGAHAAGRGDVPQRRIRRAGQVGATRKHAAHQCGAAGPAGLGSRPRVGRGDRGRVADCDRIRDAPVSRGTSRRYAALAARARGRCTRRAEGRGRRRKRSRARRRSRATKCRKRSCSTPPGRMYCWPTSRSWPSRPTTNPRNGRCACPMTISC